MSLKTLSLLLLLVAIATLVESAPGWPALENFEKRSMEGEDGAAWAPDGANAADIALLKRGMTPACGNDCFSCGKRFITSAYSQSDCLVTCSRLPNHRDRDCQEHRIG